MTGNLGWREYCKIMINMIILVPDKESDKHSTVKVVQESIMLAVCLPIYTIYTQLKFERGRFSRTRGNGHCRHKVVCDRIR